MRIKLSARQAELLDEILATCLADLSLQIAATDAPGLRDQMQDRRAQVVTIKLALDQQMSRSTGRVLTGG